MVEAQPTQWTRDTCWRQGSVLPAAAVESLDLHHPTEGATTCVVVISHDCDLANDNLDAEPDVEVIIGQGIEREIGNFTWGKSPRKLHYTVTCAGAERFVELVSTGKCYLAKSDLAQFEPDDRYSLNGKALAALRSWLGSRYNRAAFPDSFVARMRDTKADSKLAKALEKHGEQISFIYFDVDEGRNLERVEGDPYELSIVLVFPPGNDAEAAADKADEVAALVENNVGSRLQDGKAIFLKSCFAICEDDLPVSKAKLLAHWRLEHMTLSADNEQPSPPAL
jgi:hypothetical protein